MDAGLPTDDTWTFAVLTPDALVSERLDDVLGILDGHGFSLRACRLLRLDWERMRCMYSHAEVPPEADDAPEARRGMLPGVVMRQVYALAPAALLVLTHRTGEACAALLKAKGATQPYEAAPGTVRALGEHAIFNLMHCPDNPPSAAIELPYLVGDDDARALVRLATGDSEEARSLVDAAQLRRCLPALAGPEALSFPFLANRLHARVVQLLAPRQFRAGRPMAPLLEADAALQRERTALAGAASVDERLRIARPALPVIHAALADAAGGGAIRRGLEELAALYDVSDQDKVLPLPSWPADAIYVGPLERASLDAHRHA